MRYRRMGDSGLRVSELSLGGWSVAQHQLEEQELNRLLSEALERGVNLIDLADIYGQGEVESLYGRLLRDYPRHQLVLTSKCYWPMSQGVNDRGLSRKHIHESVAGSLRRLNTDYIDLYYCHRFDTETPLTETIRALGDLISRGQILYWGVCGWSVSQLREALELCQALNVPAPISHQTLYNVLERGVERELLPSSQRLGLGVSVWSPLAGGSLARCRSSQDGGVASLNGGVDLSQDESWSTSWSALSAKDEQYDTTSDAVSGAAINSAKRALLEHFGEIADQAQLSPAQLALLWTLRRSEVSNVILSVSSTAHLQENLKALDHNVNETIWRMLDERFPL